MSLVPFGQQLQRLIDNSCQFDQEAFATLLDNPANALQFLLFLQNQSSDRRKYLVAMLPGKYADYIIDRGLDYVITTLHAKVERRQLAVASHLALLAAPVVDQRVPEIEDPQQREIDRLNASSDLEDLLRTEIRPGGAMVYLVAECVAQVQNQYYQMTFAEVLELLAYTELELRNLGFDQDHILEVFDLVMYDRCGRTRPTEQVRDDLPEWLADLMLALNVCMVVMEDCTDDVDPIYNSQIPEIPGLDELSRTVAFVQANAVVRQHHRARNPDERSAFSLYPQMADALIARFDLDRIYDDGLASTPEERTTWYVAPVFNRVLGCLDYCAIFAQMDYCPVCDGPCAHAD